MKYTASSEGALLKGRRSRPRSPSGVAVNLCLLAIRAYQKVISPCLPHVCRFAPSCSEYAVIALRRHGLIKGGVLTAKRLARCGPWCEGGVDEVPE